MADEPENLILRLLQDMRAEMRERFDRVEIAVAALSVDIKGVKESVEVLGSRMETVEGRLNTIDARLARIEKHSGLVKA